MPLNESEQLRELTLEEAEILTMRAKAQGEVFERLTERLHEIRARIQAIEPIPTIGRILPDVWERLTQTAAEIDGRTDY